MHIGRNGVSISIWSSEDPGGVLTYTYKPIYLHLYLSTSLYTSVRARMDVHCARDLEGVVRGRWMFDDILTYLLILYAIPPAVMSLLLF